MGWLSKIFKRPNHKVTDGRYDWRYRADTMGNLQSTSWTSSSEFEDIDHAIALSLSEADQKGKAPVGREPQFEEDEVLARALQENLNAESRPVSWSTNYDGGNGYGYGYGSDNLYQPITFPYSTSFRICAGCNIEIGHGRFLSCMSAVWHPECFRCRGCSQPISDYEFSVSRGHAYHKTCYKEYHHPKCDVCRHFIPTNAAGLIEYRAHPFWSQKYCPRHEHDGTPRCCSCERMESWDSRFAALSDCRKLCLECLDSAIMDTKECQPLFLEIQEFFKGLNMKLTQQVPLLLVEKQALNSAMGGEKHGHHHMPETRGLCLSEEQTVSTILRRPRIGAGNRVRTEPYKLTRHCEVTAILILYGLPRLLTGTILAHEMMHAWLRLNGYRTLRQDVEEGICQVIASMWLESQILSMSDSNSASTSSSTFTSPNKGGRSPFETKLSKFFKQQIATDTSPVYGNGFRAGHQAVVRFGLQRTLDHMRKTGNFPH
ncbi:UNVERIFIED_CONTAM: Protein DA1-related 1 [Sesamum indicum]